MYAAIDIGGTKTLIAVFDETGTVAEQVKFPTPKDYGDFTAVLSEAMAGLNTKDFKTAAVAVPGRIDRKNGVALAFGNLDWENIPFQADMEPIVKAPVIIENDAKLAALSEGILLLGKYRKSLYVTISTGIGAGLVIDGKLDTDFEDMEAGHMLLEHGGEMKDWEDFGSGKAFSKKFGKRVSEVADDDAEAWQWFAHNIALGLLNLAAILTPEVIVIGGGAGAHLDKFKDKLDDQLKKYENPMFAIPPIVKAQRAEEAVIYGCFELAKQYHEQLTSN